MRRSVGDEMRAISNRLSRNVPASDLFVRILCGLCDFAVKESTADADAAEK